MLAEVVVPTKINELVGVPQSSAYLYCLSSRPSLIGLSPHCGQWWLSNNICKLVVVVVVVVVRKENSGEQLLLPPRLRTMSGFCVGTPHVSTKKTRSINTGLVWWQLLSATLSLVQLMLSYVNVNVERTEELSMQELSNCECMHLLRSVRLRLLISLICIYNVGVGEVTRCSTSLFHLHAL